MKTLIQNHPIASFIVLTLAWSWGFWTLLFTQIRPGGVLNNPLPAAYVLILLGGIGPSVVGLILTKIVSGKRGMDALKKRITFKRVGKLWVALLIAPLLTLVMPVVREVVYGNALSWNVVRSSLLPSIIIGSVAGLMEEFGWRGFLLPQLLKKYSPLMASLIIGMVWGGLWHGYADYFGLGDRGLYFIPMMLLVGPLLLTVWSIFLTWLHLRTDGNLLMSILFHATISSSAYTFGQKFPNFTQEVWWTFASVGVAILAAWGLIHKTNKLEINRFHQI